MRLTIDDHSFEVDFTADGVTVDGEPFRVTVDGTGSTRLTTVNGRAIRVDVDESVDDATSVNVEGQILRVQVEGTMRKAAGAARQATRAASAGSSPASAIKGAVAAQMTGRVVRVAVTVGETIAAGDLLLILEAMKMENEVRSPRGGTIKEVRVAAGDRVSQGEPMVVMED